MTESSPEVTPINVPQETRPAKRRTVLIWVLLGLAIVVAGVCGAIALTGGVEPLANLISPKLVEVTGRVNFNGKPLTAGYIQSFYERQGWMGAMGEIKPDGSFRLVTNGDPGAYSGKHRVIVMWMTNNFPPKHLLPEVYTQPQTTPLVIQVSRSEKNDFQFDLVDAQ